MKQKLFLLFFCIIILITSCEKTKTDELPLDDLYQNNIKDEIINDDNFVENDFLLQAVDKMEYHGYLYYYIMNDYRDAEYDPHGTMYRKNLADDSIEELFESISCLFTIKNDWIYYFNRMTIENNAAKLYRMRLDGSDV